LAVRERNSLSVLGKDFESSDMSSSVSLFEKLVTLVLISCSHVLFTHVFHEFSVVSVLNAKFRQCLSDCKQLNTPGLLQKAGVDPGSTNITADRILYNHAIQMVRKY
jgi:hypothetical protein